MPANTTTSSHRHLHWYSGFFIGITQSARSDELACAFGKRAERRKSSKFREIGRAGGDT
jgi:hypothetical protein